MHRRFSLILSYILVLTLFFVFPGFGQNLEEFEKSVTEFELDNGMKFIVVERHDVPVVSFVTFAHVGAVNEVKGITGLAHIFEHMAFKGTKTIGTKNLQKELEAMKRVDQLFETIRKLRFSKDMKSKERLKELEKEFKKAQEEAQKYANSREFGEIIERAGGQYLNAFTTSDATGYFFSLPSNKIELWFALESDRFLNPVLREFYKEKDVVMEERRMRTESSPVGRLLEEFTTTAFKAHPYGEPVVGHMSDLQNISRAQALRFFQTYYGANNLVAVLVGDVHPDEVKQLAQTYFGRLPKKPQPPPVVTQEPPQKSERRVILYDVSKPFLIMGWHKGNMMSAEDPVFEVLADVLGNGRTSRLYKRLVKKEKVAVNVGAMSSYPGEEYPNLFAIYVVPSSGHTAEECEKLVWEEIEKLKKEKVKESELKKAVTRARANILYEIKSDLWLGVSLASYQTKTGDWRNFFTRLDRIEKVTIDDIQSIAQTYLTRSNATVAYIKTIESSESKPSH